ncbi:MAG: hypothetical protein COB54_01320 [Alphaproteobacteria bacterium]|nr:MAG: hypothetical protein COB54_01320 [Alphaproteobacteria bacterium]
MDVEAPLPREKSKQTYPDGFPVSLGDIKPLLDMTSIAATAETFHKYSDRDTQRGPEQEKTLPLSDYFRILWELSVALQDETIHLSSRHLMPGSTSFIMSNISASSNLEEAMRLIAKSYNLLHGGPYNRVEVRGDTLLYIIDDSQFPYMTRKEDYIHFTMECVLIYLHGILSFITSRDLRPLLRKVYTKRSRGPMNSRHMDFWTVPVRYQSGQYTLTYDLTAAQLPITINQQRLPSSREIYDHVIEMIEQSAPGTSSPLNSTDRVRQAIDLGLLDQPSVARHLGLSVATLRRRLSLEKTTFRQVVRLVLNQKSLDLMSQGVHISDIAEELGFSDFRSFIRAFKNWNGLTPTAYIKAQTKK